MSEPKKFKRGDVVRLNSGGPDMTVNGAHPISAIGEQYESLECMWFDQVHLHHGNFASDAVRKVESPKVIKIDGPGRAITPEWIATAPTA